MVSMDDSSAPKKFDEALPPPEVSERVARQVFARLYQPDQRVDGRERWTVGESPRLCRGCREEFPQGSPFHSVLKPADGAEEERRSPDLSALFSRHDYCQRCFPSVRLENAFAHWTCTFPAPAEPAQKSFNLPRLRHLFDQLTPPEAGEEGAEREEQGEPGAEQLRYLLALFLVRKRVFSWEGRAGDQILLSCRRTDQRYRLTIPKVPPEEILARVEEFAALFA